MTECVVDWRNVAISLAAEIARIPDADRVRWRLESAAETGSSWLRPDYRAAADLVAEEIAARDKPLATVGVDLDPAVTRPAVDVGEAV